MQHTLNSAALSQNLVDLGRQLLDACRDGKVEEAKSLMTNGAPFTTDWLGASPLHFAAANGHGEVIDVLLRAGVSRDTRTKVERTPLHVAAQEGHLDIVNMLLTHGADVDAKDILKMTPLHWAVERGYLDVVEALLNHGADAQEINKFDKTPYDIAVDSSQTAMTNLLSRHVQGGGGGGNRLRSYTKNEHTNNSTSTTRPIVLPNKATRTSKNLKGIISCPPTSSPANNVHKVNLNQKHVSSSPSTPSNVHKVVLIQKSGSSTSISLESLNLSKELFNYRKQLQEAKSLIQEKDREIERLRELLKDKDSDSNNE